MKKIKIVFLIIITLVLVFYIFNTTKCLNGHFNIKHEFSIHFEKGSSESELLSFIEGFKEKYGDTKVVEFVTDQQSLEQKKKTYKEMYPGKPEFLEGLDDFATATITVKVSISDLGSLEEFNNFISNSINKYPTIKIRQYSGSVPDNILDSDSKKDVVMWCLIPAPIKLLLLASSF